MPNAKAALDAVTTLLEVALPNICDVLGSDQIVQLDVAMAPHLKAAAQAQIDLVVQAIDADTSNSALQEAGARFVAYTGETCRDLWMARGGDKVLARAVQRHAQSGRTRPGTTGTVATFRAATTRCCAAGSRAQLLC